MDKLRGQKKGVLLTLATIILLILLIGTITTLLYANIQYNTLSLQSNPAIADASFYSTLQSGIVPAIHASLAAAVSGLANYELTNNTLQINNTAYALSTMMTSNMLYGKPVLQYIGNATIQSYINQTQRIAKSENINLSIQNSTLLIFQSNPYTINASYSALARINSSTGLLTIPINVTTSLNLQGTPDLYLSNTGVQGYFQYSNSSNSIAVSTLATAGSNSPYLFSYGPLFFDSNTPAICNGYLANVPVQSDYILVANSAIDINSISVCGFSGLITNVLNSTIPPLKPYLLFPATYNVMLVPQGRYIVGGKSLQLTDPTPVDSAIENGYYQASGFSPSYLQLSSGTIATYSPYGIAPFWITSRAVASLNNNPTTANNLNITASGIPVNTIAGGYNTVSFWMQLANTKNAMVIFSSNSYYIISYANSIAVDGSNSGNVVDSINDKQFLNKQWVNVIASLYNGVPNSINTYLYLDGVRQPLTNSIGISSSSMNSLISIGGSAANGLAKFKGQIANVQLYNSPLTPYQAYSIYLGGINAKPISYANLTGWWPLNGNANDISRYHNNGVLTNNAPTIPKPFFSRITDYDLDTLNGGSPFPSTFRLSGLSQCYLISNCSYSVPSQVYVPMVSNYSSNSIDLPDSYFGLPNTTIPAAVMFDYGQNASIIASGITTNSAGGGGDTVSFWMSDYLQSTTQGAFFINNLGGLASSGACFGFAVQGTPTTISGISTATISKKWVNVIAKLVNGASTSQLYINGVLQPSTCGSSVTLSSSPGTTSVTIGGVPNNAADGFSGSIADVQVYNSLLLASQIYSLYLNNSVAGSGAPIPTAAWPLESGYNGYLNQTGPSAGGIIGYVHSNNAACIEANSVDAMGGQCGVEFLPHDVGN